MGFCVEWMDGPDPTPPIPAGPMFRANRIDYKDVLEPEAFDRFVRLRKVRLEIAKADGVQSFVVMTDKQMAELAKAANPTKAALSKIVGFGDSRVEKYGERLLAGLAALSEIKLQPDAEGSGGREEKPESGNVVE